MHIQVLDADRKRVHRVRIQQVSGSPQPARDEPI
jgi:hypothetical protein